MKADAQNYDFEAPFQKPDDTIPKGLIRTLGPIALD